jgi:hypothetical protein
VCDCRFCGDDLDDEEAWMIEATLSWLYPGSVCTFIIKRVCGEDSMAGIESGS